MNNSLDEIFEKISERRPQTPFAVELWDGSVKQYGRGEQKFKIIIRTSKTVEKILAGGTLGFGEEYMAGNIAVEGDLQQMLGMYGVWQECGRGLSLATKVRVLSNMFFSRGTVSNSRKNVAHHYDIGDDFYSLWLDKTMTYTCAYFKDAKDSLETAQNNKYDHICRKLRLKPGEKLLDIGCGWGGMMFFAAKNYGAKCTGYTLSKNQYGNVSARIEREGLGDSVKIYFKDYRQVAGVFDKFVSIGMFEQVGRRYFPDFFAMVKSSLKPRGTGLLHTIGSARGAATDPWIAKYIFPGGFIPALSMVLPTMTKSGLIFFDIEDLRLHYAKTLDLWAGDFEKNLEAVKKIISRDLGDANLAENFIRMWRLYLNASSMSFKDGSNRLYQIVFTNGVNNDLPLTRDYIYSQEP